MSFGELIWVGRQAFCLNYPEERVWYQNDPTPYVDEDAAHNAQIVVRNCGITSHRECTNSSCPMLQMANGFKPDNFIDSNPRVLPCGVLGVALIGMVAALGVNLIEVSNPELFQIGDVKKLADLFVLACGGGGTAIVAGVALSILARMKK